MRRLKRSILRPLTAFLQWNNSPLWAVVECLEMANPLLTLTFLVSSSKNSCHSVLSGDGYLRFNEQRMRVDSK